MVDDVTPDKLPADMEAVIARLDEDYATLLKAYQEQRRALERIINAADARITKRHIRDYAAEALNQKGDER